MTDSRYLDPEDEAFNEIERQAKQRKESVKAQFDWKKNASDYERGVIDGMQKQMQSSVDKAVNSMQSDERKFLAGWNGALELAAFEIEHMKGFGQDTISSFAIYIRGMKK